MKQTLNGERMEKLGDLYHFPLNPRRGLYRATDRLMESLKAEGQHEALTVWRAGDGTLQVLQGNRRMVCMKQLGWRECRVVEKSFADDAHALAWLMNQQENNDPFDAVERALGVQDLLRLGVGMEETCRAVGRTTETVQLWLELGDMPALVHKAVRSGDISLETVGLLAKLDKGAERDSGLQMVLNGLGGAMSSAQAKLTLQQNFLDPKKHLAEWMKLMPKLKRTLSVDAHEYVEFADRLQYVQGPTGQPEDDYEWAKLALPAVACPPAGVASWGDAAELLGLKVYVVPAPAAADGYVLVVNKKDVRTVDMDTGGRVFGKVREVKERGGALKERVAADVRSAEGDTAEREQADADAAAMERMSMEAHARILGGEEELPPVVEEAGLTEEQISYGRRIMAQVHEALSASANLNRTQAVWLPLMRYLLRDADANELMRTYAPGGVMAAMAADKRGMAALRWVVLHGLAAALVAGDDAAVAEVMEAVGIE